MAELVGVVGLGYVGLPLALCVAERGARVVGVDVDEGKAAALREGQSYLRHIAARRVASALEGGRFTATSDFAALRECTAVIIAVPTPLTAAREPDLSFVVGATRAVAPHLRRGMLVALESTTYPGTTREEVIPILEKVSGLTAGDGFNVVFSPEREDPGNPSFSTANIPKVVGGLTSACLERGLTVYKLAVDKVVPVTTLEAAEMTKLLENIFRAVNIAMVNEMKVLAHRFTDAGRPIDIHEVIQAASTKPFGFMPFNPGPGLGGHCIPIDPFYLTWKARQLDFATRFIELAGEINTSMPYYVLNRAMGALSDRRKSLCGADVLVLGVAYKADVEDVRESPSLKLIELLRAHGAHVAYHDPYVATLTCHAGVTMASEPLTPERLRRADAVLVSTAHRCIDYRLVAEHAQLVVDTRDAMRQSGIAADRLVRA
ncbi:MAG: nucleotide sugar dehydrogenase [Anaeromyxobacteraceae bacterium]